MKKKVETKIVGGKYKGRILDLPSLEVTRSSKSILKESFFNVLQFDIIDTIFIEAFGGSGGIGLEAISRGAKHSYFCEINKNSFQILRQNCEKIEPQSCTTMYGDSFEKIPTLLTQLQREKTTDEIILYLDPPFDMRAGMSDIYEKAFEIVKNIPDINVILVVFEHSTEIDMPDKLGKFEKFKNKKFGKSSLTYYHV